SSASMPAAAGDCPSEDPGNWPVTESVGAAGSGTNRESVIAPLGIAGRAELGRAVAVAIVGARRLTRTGDGWVRALACESAAVEVADTALADMASGELDASSPPTGILAKRTSGWLAMAGLLASARRLSPHVV